MKNADTILSEYREVFRKYRNETVIDLDKRVQQKISFTVYPFQQIVEQLHGTVPPNRHSLYYIGLIKKGAGKKSIGPFNFNIQNHTLYCIPERIVNASEYGTAGFSGYHLSFNIDFFLQKAFPAKLVTGKNIFKPSAKPYLILSAEQVRSIETVFESILEESQQAVVNAGSELIAIKILELLNICDRYFTGTQLGSPAIFPGHTFEKFKELLHKNFTHHRSVKFYAQSLNMHPHHLNYLAQKHVGISAKQMINNHVFNEARYLLASSSLSVKEIAYKLGFEYPESFYLFFRKHSGLSPAKYRHSLL